MITTNTIWNSTLRWWNTSLRWYLGECRYDRLWKDILHLSCNAILTWDVVLRRHLSLSLDLTLRCNRRLTWDVVLRCQLCLSQNLILERNTAVCFEVVDLRWDSILGLSLQLRLDFTLRRNNDSSVLNLCHNSFLRILFLTFFLGCFLFLVKMKHDSLFYSSWPDALEATIDTFLTTWLAQTFLKSNHVVGRSDHCAICYSPTWWLIKPLG